MNFELCVYNQVRIEVVVGLKLCCKGTFFFAYIQIFELKKFYSGGYMFAIWKGYYFFTFSFGKIWKFENLFVSLQSLFRTKSKEPRIKTYYLRSLQKNRELYTS